MPRRRSILQAAQQSMQSVRDLFQQHTELSPEDRRAASEAQEIRRLEQRKARKLWLLLPDDPQLDVWQVWVMGPLIIYSCIVVPVIVAWDLQTTVPQDVVDYVFDFTFLVDIFVNFSSAYYDDDKEVVLDRKLISKRYAKSWFPLDFFATVPWELFAGSGSSSLGVLRLPRVLRIGRLLKKFDAKASANLFRIFKLLMGFFLLNHWVACAWWWIGRAEYSNTHEHGEAWVVRVDAPLIPEETDVLVQYISALYWSLTMLMKSPYIGPDTLGEKLFSCAMVVLGTLIFAIILSQITAMFLSFDRANMQYRTRAQEFQAFAGTRRLKYSLRKKLLQFFTQQWALTLGYDEREIFAATRVGRPLSRPILLSVYHDLRPTSSFLRAFEQPVLAELVTLLHPMVCLQKETLLAASDVCTQLYLLVQGSLQAAAAATPEARQSKGGNSFLKTGAAAEDTGSPKKKGGNNRASTSGWKAKLQVRVVETPGAVVGFAQVFEQPRTLPFNVTALKRSVLLVLEQGPLRKLLRMVGSAERAVVVGEIRDQHENVLESIKAKGTSSGRITKPDPDASFGLSGSLTDASGADAKLQRAKVGAKAGIASRSEGGDTALGEARISALEAQVAACSGAMAQLRAQAAAIPAIVRALEQRPPGSLRR